MKAGSPLGTSAPTSPAPGAAPRQLPTVDETQLREAVGFMDHIAQSGFAGIKAVARLAVARLEAPDGYDNLKDISDALALIWATAETSEGEINATADSVGCAHVDHAALRRMAAARTFQASREG